AIFSKKMPTNHSQWVTDKRFRFACKEVLISRPIVCRLWNLGSEAKNQFSFRVHFHTVNNMILTGAEEKPTETEVLISSHFILVWENDFLCQMITSTYNKVLVISTMI